jgi:xylulokinase
VVCGSNDTTVELFGVGAVRPGQGAIKLATAGVLSLVTDGPSVHPPISCYPHIVSGLYYTATGTNSCASAHRWLRDQFFLRPGDDGDAAFAEMDRLAAEVPPGSEGLIFHPYLQGERAPYWDPFLRGDFLGLTMGHGRAHFARALYEGIAFSIRDLLETARALGLAFGAVRLIGGGARSALWRRIIADATGLTVERPEHGDASYGAGLIAGVGAGVLPSADAAVEACVRIADRREPDPKQHAFYGELFALYKDAQSALAPLAHRLHRLLDRR